MKGLTKDEREQYEKHKARLTALKDDFDDALTVFEGEVAELFDDQMTEYVDALHNAVDDVNCWLVRVARKYRTKHDDGSEKWQDSEVGQAFESFVDGLEYAEVDDPAYELSNIVNVEHPNMGAFEDMDLEPEDV